MFLADMSEIWISVAEWLQYGIEWISDKGGGVLESLFYFVTGGSVVTGLVYALKVGMPLIKGLNTPVLKKVNELLVSFNGLMERVESQKDTIEQLKTDNATLKDFIATQSELNSKSILVSDDMKAKFGLITSKLKESEVEKLKDIGEDIETALEDNELTVQESIEIMENVPIIEEALGMSIDDIELKLRGETNE